MREVAACPRAPRISGCAADAPPRPPLTKKKIRCISHVAPGEKKTLTYVMRVKEKGEQQVIVGVKSKDQSEGLGRGAAFVSFINPEPVKDTGTHTIDSDGTRAFVK